MLTNKSKRILKNGLYINYDFFKYSNGHKYIAKYRGHWYHIIDDGTANGFYCAGDADQITEEEAIRIVLTIADDNDKKTFFEILGRELSDNEIDVALGL